LATGIACGSISASKSFLTDDGFATGLAVLTFNRIGRAAGGISAIIAGENAVGTIGSCSAGSSVVTDFGRVSPIGTRATNECRCAIGDGGTVRSRTTIEAGIRDARSGRTCCTIGSVD
jgi:hypothetical protein